jgi:glycosyltransferase A (GT-A) superfamily protein (DUF2064 family)
VVLEVARDLDPGQVDRRLLLKGGDDVARLVSRQLPERAAVLVRLAEERAAATVDGGWAGSSVA